VTAAVTPRVAAAAAGRHHADFRYNVHAIIEEDPE
jgi:hypothetical protein